MICRHFQSSSSASKAAVTHLSRVLRHLDTLDVVQPGLQPHTQCNREKVGQLNIYDGRGSGGRGPAGRTKDEALTHSAASTLSLHPDVSADSALRVCVCFNSIECAWPEIYRVSEDLSLL